MILNWTTREKQRLVWSEADVQYVGCTSDGRFIMVPETTFDTYRDDVSDPYDPDVWVGKPDVQFFNDELPDSIEADREIE